jgi:hypothetical protein
MIETGLGRLTRVSVSFPTLRRAPEVAAGAVAAGAVAAGEVADSLIAARDAIDTFQTFTAKPSLSPDAFFSYRDDDRRVASRVDCHPIRRSRPSLHPFLHRLLSLAQFARGGPTAHRGGSLPPEHGRSLRAPVM